MVSISGRNRIKRKESYWYQYKNYARTQDWLEIHHRSAVNIPDWKDQLKLKREDTSFIISSATRFSLHLFMLYLHFQTLSVEILNSVTVLTFLQHAEFRKTTYLVCNSCVKLNAVYITCSIYIYTHTHTHTHIYIHTHTHTHTYIYIYIYHTL